MIATHNIKVNGRWVRAGERYGEEPVKPVQTGLVIVEEGIPEKGASEAETTVAAYTAEPPKTAARTRTSSRRKAK